MRWVLSPVIGNGTSNIDPLDPENTGPYRALASKYGAHAALIPGNADGTPKFNWSLCWFDGDVTAAANDPELTVFPDLQLDDVLTLAQRNWLITKVGNLGKPTGWIVAGITVRECVQTIGRYLEDNYDVNWMRIA